MTTEPESVTVLRLTPSEIRAGISELAVNEWSIYRTCDYDHAKKEPLPGVQKLPPRTLTPTEKRLK